MTKFFVNQGKEYADARPSYPPQLFRFIASKTPSHNLVWDVATGSGQAAKSVSSLFSPTPFYLFLKSYCTLYSQNNIFFLILSLNNYEKLKMTPPLLE
jgi:hypothetical protein